jgi:hypothetical protein
MSCAAVQSGKECSNHFRFRISGLVHALPPSEVWGRPERWGSLCSVGALDVAVYGRVALVAVGSAEYQAFTNDPNIKQLKALRSKRA